MPLELSNRNGFDSGPTLVKSDVGLIASEGPPDATAAIDIFHICVRDGRPVVSIIRRVLSAGVVGEKCQRLVIGTGAGALPVMKDVRREAQRRKIELLILPTKEAIKQLKQARDGTNAVPARHLLEQGTTEEYRYAHKFRE